MRLPLRVEDDDDEEEEVDEDDESSPSPFPLCVFFAPSLRLLLLRFEVRKELEFAAEAPTSTFSIPHAKSSAFLFLTFFEPASLPHDRPDDDVATTGGTNKADAGMGVPLVRCSYLRIRSTRVCPSSNSSSYSEFLLIR